MTATTAASVKPQPSATCHGVENAMLPPVHGTSGDRSCRGEPYSPVPSRCRPDCKFSRVPQRARASVRACACACAVQGVHVCVRVPRARVRVQRAMCNPSPGPCPPISRSVVPIGIVVFQGNLPTTRHAGAWQTDSAPKLSPQHGSETRCAVTRDAWRRMTDPNPSLLACHSTAHAKATRDASRTRNSCLAVHAVSHLCVPPVSEQQPG